MDKECFLDSGRGFCQEKCMAYYEKADGKSGCLLLKTAESFTTLFTSLTKPKMATKYPKSAPPPEVKL